MKEEVVLLPWNRRGLCVRTTSQHPISTTSTRATSSAQESSSPRPRRPLAWTPSPSPTISTPLARSPSNPRTRCASPWDSAAATAGGSPSPRPEAASRPTCTWAASPPSTAERAPLLPVFVCSSCLCDKGGNPIPGLWPHAALRLRARVGGCRSACQCSLNQGTCAVGLGACAH